MSDWTEGVQIPITTPGGPEGAAVLRALAQAMKDVGGETQNAAAKVDAAKTAFNFNQLVEAAGRLHEGFTRFAASVADLASEQARLDANSARLGLDFNAAADAAGRFTDETEAMAAATRLSEAGINLTQTQLDSLTRVAARFAQNTGTTTAGAIDTLTNGLITGSQRGLRPFGDELARVGVGSHTAEERLHALTEQAGHTEQATDDAASSMARLNDRVDDMKRTLATAFAQGITDTLRLSEAADAAGTKFDILDADITRAGRTIGTVVVGIGNGLAIIVGGVATGIASMLSGVVAGVSAAGAVIDRLRSGHLSGIGAAASSAFNASMADSPITASLARFTEGRVAAGESILGSLGEAGESGATASTVARERAGVSAARRGGEGGADEHAKSAKADLLEVQRLNAAAYAAERAANQRAQETAAREAETHDAEARRQLDEASTRLHAEQERAKAESVEGARATRETERLRREQQRRLDMTQTYTERMRDLHGQEFDSTQALAEGTTAAFAGMADAFGKHLQAFVTGKETIGDALQGMLSDTLASIAQQATVKGALELAEGIAALAGIVTAPLAPGHFAAAGAYFGVAALAGVGAAAVAPSSPSVAAPASAPRESAARLPKGGAASEGGGTVYNVTFGGPMYGTGGVRQAARQMVGAINRGAVQGGVQLLPGVLMGGGAGS